MTILHARLESRQVRSNNKSNCKIMEVNIRNLIKRIYRLQEISSRFGFIVACVFLSLRKLHLRAEISPFCCVYMCKWFFENYSIDTFDFISCPAFHSSEITNLVKIFNLLLVLLAGSWFFEPNFKEQRKIVNFYIYLI